MHKNIVCGPLNEKETKANETKMNIHPKKNSFLILRFFSPLVFIFINIFVSVFLGFLPIINKQQNIFAFHAAVDVDLATLFRLPLVPFAGKNNLIYCIKFNFFIKNFLRPFREAHRFAIVRRTSEGGLRLKECLKICMQFRVNYERRKRIL